MLILTYNGKTLLEDSIKSYSENSYSNFRIVVIDNGSTDGTKEYVQEQFPYVSLIRVENNRGYSGGFNVGIKYAIDEMNADYVLITNDDVIVDPSAISELVNVASMNKKIGFVTGKVYYYDLDGNNNILQTVGRESSPLSLIGGIIGNREEDLGQYDKVVERVYCDDVYLLVKREVIDKVGTYSEHFFHEYEEIDWQHRSKKVGFKIYYTPYAKLWHKISSTTGGYRTPKIAYYNSRNGIVFVARHGTLLIATAYILKYLFWEIPAMSLSNVLKNRTDLVIARHKGVLSGLAWIIQKPSLESHKW